MSGGGECELMKLQERHPCSRLIRRAGLGEDVADLRLELGVKSSAAKVELVLIVLRMLNS